MGNRPVVARRLKQARVRAGISQKLLGIRAGVGQLAASARINQYERAKHQPDVLTVERLAKVLGVPSPYFYAQDERLAEWILAFQRLSPAVRRSVVRMAQPKQVVAAR